MLRAATANLLLEWQEARDARRICVQLKGATLFGRRPLSNRELWHYTMRLRHSRRMRYRTARLLVIWLPLLIFLYALLLAARTP